VTHRQYETAGEAIAEAKLIVDEELEHFRNSPDSADNVLETYLQFGADPFIVSDGPTVIFSARDYAREQCREMSGDKATSLSDWFNVTFDDASIELKVNAPMRESWQVEIRWNRIIRICFKTGDFLASDEIYIFSDERTESWLVPMEANGGSELWDEIIRRSLFDPELAIKAAASVEDKLFCWPKVEPE